MHRLWSELRFRVRALFARSAMERELDAELRYHLEHETEKFVRSGMSRAEAERRARASFGAVDGIKDDARDARGLVWFETAIQDVRYALRGLRTRQSFAFGIIAALGLGVGANAAMFGIVDRLLFRPPAFLRDADLVHRIYQHRRSDLEVRTDRNFAFPVYLDLQRLTRSFDRVAAFQTVSRAVGEGQETREVQVTVASAEYFDLFDARPVLGRFFDASDARVPDGAPVVVLGHAFWQTAFGGRADVIGAQIRVDRVLCTIIGVAPEGFVGVSDQGVPALYMPITTHAFALRGAQYPSLYGWSWLEMVARRRPEVSVAAAQADLTEAFRQSWRLRDASEPGWGSVDDTQPRGELGPIQLNRGPMAGPEAMVALWVSGVGVIVLLVACANVANLLLTRAIGRQREIAVRLALGVSRGRLVRQLLTENLVLAVLGGALGVALGHWAAMTLGALFLPDDVSAGVMTDGRTLVVAAVATFAAAIVTGLAPALQAGRTDLATTFRTGVREGTTPRSRLRTALLVFQAALSVVLLIGAGLFVRSLHNVRSYRLGYDVEPVLFAWANPRGTELTPAERVAVVQRMLETARAVPGVTHAALAASVPFFSNEGRGLEVPGVDSVSRRGRFILQAASPDYFATMGTRILQGRAFDDRDAANAPPVVVVSEGMARALWPGRDPIGQCIRIRYGPPGSGAAPCTTVIGVAEEARVRSLADPRDFMYYLPLAQYPDPPDGQVFARVTGDPASRMADLRHALQEIMPGAAYVRVIRLAQLVDPNLRAWKFGATVFVAFGGLALALAAIGLYSLIAYNVAQRRHELGVRIALGASTGQVMRLVVARGVWLAGIGVAIGVAIAFLAAPQLASALFRATPRDPVVYGTVAVLLIAVAVAASLVPALRASRVAPQTALRTD